MIAVWQQAVKLFYLHLRKRTDDENHGNGEEYSCHGKVYPSIHDYRKLKRKQPEQRCKLYYRVHGNRGRILERIAHCIADYGGLVQLGAFFLHVHFDHFFGIIPRAAGICHKYRLEQTEYRYRDKIADKEKRVKAGERKRAEKYHKEKVKHSLLRIPGADLNDFFAVFGGRPLDACIKFDIRLDELDGFVRAACNRMVCRACKPVNNRAAGNHAQQKRRMED